METALKKEYHTIETFVPHTRGKRGQSRGSNIGVLIKLLNVGLAKKFFWGVKKKGEEHRRTLAPGCTQTKGCNRNQISVGYTISISGKHRNGKKGGGRSVKFNFGVYRDSGSQDDPEGGKRISGQGRIDRRVDARGGGGGRPTCTPISFRPFRSAGAKRRRSSHGKGRREGEKEQGAGVTGEGRKTKIKFKGRQKA